MVTLPVPKVGEREAQWTVPDDGLTSRRARQRGSGTYRAAIPARIAELALDVPADLAADIADAETSLLRFDHHARDVLGADAIALGPMSSILLRTESASSSQIEHITVGARQLAIAELGEDPAANARLVAGNVHAMRAALDLADRLDLDALLAMHHALLASEPREADQVGAVRDRVVWVGRSAVGPRDADFVPPLPQDVSAALSDLVAFLARQDLPTLLQTAIAHAQFETIHPFTDGNGRVGRALVHGVLRRNGLVPTTTAPVSAGLLRRTERYIDALTAYRGGDAAPITQAMADAARYAAATGIDLIDELAAQLDEAREMLGTLRPHAIAWQLLPLLVAQPVLTSPHAQHLLGVSATSALRALSTLTDAGILVERTGRRRNRLWEHRGILAVLDDYASSIRRG